MVIKDKLDLKSREYLRLTTLNASTFYTETHTKLQLERLAESFVSTPKMELTSINEDVDIVFDKNEEDMSPLEFGQYAEPKIRAYFQKHYEQDTKICDKTFIKESEGITLSANIDGFIGENFDKATSLIEIKTSKQHFLDIYEVANKNEYKFQMQFYLYFFPNITSIYLIYYNRVHKSLHIAKFWKDPVIQSQIKARIKKFKEVLTTKT